MSGILRSILQKLTIRPKEETRDLICQHYDENASVVIHFLYYANLRFLSDHTYVSALNSADVLLPDGIALRLLWSRIHTGSFTDFVHRRASLLSRISNLNGTDFVPYFLRTLIHSKKSVRIFLYGGKQETVQKAAQKLQAEFTEYTFHAEQGYTPLDPRTLDAFFHSGTLSWTDNHETYNILLVGLGTPKQECWIAEHRSYFEKHHLIVFSVGGLFDFLSGTENRAPFLIRKFNLEWFYRIIANPRKNVMKSVRSFKIFWDLLFPPR